MLLLVGFSLSAIQSKQGSDNVHKFELTGWYSCKKESPSHAKENIKVELAVEEDCVYQEQRTPIFSV